MIYHIELISFYFVWRFIANNFSHVERLSPIMQHFHVKFNLCTAGSTDSWRGASSRASACPCSSSTASTPASSSSRSGRTLIVQRCQFVSSKSTLWAESYFLLSGGTLRASGALGHPEGAARRRPQQTQQVRSSKCLSYVFQTYHSKSYMYFV